MVTAALCAALAGCGPDNPAPQSAGTPTGTTTSAATAAATGGSGARVTPEQLCAMLSVADAAQISGFGVQTAEPSLSGDVAVCTYSDGTVGAKFFTQYRPNQRTLFDFTKAKGQPVSGLGVEAVYFTSSGELSVRLDEKNVFGIYVADVRMHGNDPKGGAIEIANKVLPQLPRA